MKVYVVDNGGQWTHREWRVLRYLKVETKIIPNSMGNNGEYLDKADFPIFGICAGMQFLCEHFGGTLGPGATPEFGGVGLKVSSHDDLFRGLPDEFQVWASHNDEVKTIPPGFEVTASSETCLHEAVRCIDRPIYGVQFHPEVENTEHGPEIFQNFLDIVAEQRR